MFKWFSVRHLHRVEYVVLVSLIMLLEMVRLLVQWFSIISIHFLCVVAVVFTRYVYECFIESFVINESIPYQTAYAATLIVYMPTNRNWKTSGSIMIIVQDESKRFSCTHAEFFGLFVRFFFLLLFYEWITNKIEQNGRLLLHSNFSYTFLFSSLLSHWCVFLLSFGAYLSVGCLHFRFFFLHLNKNNTGMHLRTHKQISNN